MGISDTKLCSFCKRHDETIQHLFFNCQKTNKLWNELKVKFYQKGINLPVLTAHSAYLGFPDENDILVNHLHLILKISLYTNRSKEY